MKSKILILNFFTGFQNLQVSDKLKQAVGNNLTRGVGQDLWLILLASQSVSCVSLVVSPNNSSCSDVKNGTLHICAAGCTVSCGYLLLISNISENFINKPLTPMLSLYIFFFLLHLPLREGPELGCKPFKS